VTRLFEKEYGLPVNSNPTDPRSRVRTFRMAALCSPIIASRQHRLHSSNRCVGRTLTMETAREILFILQRPADLPPSRSSVALSVMWP
jgi:hypothetical protein